jgi:hypothetical protein
MINQRLTPDPSNGNCKSDNAYQALLACIGCDMVPVRDLNGAVLSGSGSPPAGFVLELTLVRGRLDCRRIPMLAMGNQILRIPAIVLGIAGAMAGVFIVLFLPLLEWVESVIKPNPGLTQSFSLPWSYLKGWPAFCAALGAGGAMLYRWLLLRASRSEGKGAIAG